jgi:hypothetical protein
VGPLSREGNSNNNRVCANKAVWLKTKRQAPHPSSLSPPGQGPEREREREKLNTLSARFAHGSHRRIGSLVLASTHIVKADSVRVEISCAAGYLLLAALVLATAVIWFCLRRRSKGEAPRYKEVLLPSGGRVSIPVN